MEEGKGKDGSWEFTASGVSVRLPFPAYGVQKAMMAKIVRGLETSQHSLIESPTGTGKTAALLASTIGWQRKRAAELRQRAQEAKEAGAKAPPPVEKPPPVTESGEKEAKAEAQAPATPSPSPTPSPVVFDEIDLAGLEEEDDLKPMSPALLAKRQAVQASVYAAGPANSLGLYKPTPMRAQYGAERGGRKRRAEAGPSTPGSLITNFTVDTRAATPKADQRRKARFVAPPSAEGAEKPPKIFYGTRTHKQLAQVVAELARLPDHKHVLHTILASREQTCIQPEVMKTADKFTACQDLRDHHGCGFYIGLKGRFQDNPKLVRQHADLPHIFDIEDLKGAAKRGGAGKFCPYFAATRVLATDARLLFCPYNYLIDPRLRKSLQLDLKGAVIVLDEAHNIEDACREAVSFELTEMVLSEALKELRRLLGETKNHDKLATVRPALLFLNEALASLERWLVQSSVGRPDAAGMTGIRAVGLGNLKNVTYKGPSILHFLKLVRLDKESPFVEHVASVTSLLDDSKAEGKEQTVSTLYPPPDQGKLKVLEELAFAHHFIHSEENSYQDYHLHVTEFEAAAARGAGHSSPGKWGRRSTQLSQASVGRVAGLKLHLWCFNPALAFKSAFSKCRSVVVASGTMSPFGTFTGELGCAFQQKFEGSHVVSGSQFLAAAVGTGPGGVALKGVRATFDNITYQRDMGRLVAEVCETVPHGVLVFFPSYGVMAKLHQAWERLGLVERLSGRKLVLLEPSKGSVNGVKEAFDEAIRATSGGPTGSGVDGALLLAVCRGKVSEGIDFPDDLARAVIAIGIPFPALMDPQVVYKKAYNDVARSGGRRDVLSGDEWYSTQAYRALNQVLGRCIRHRKDWGVMILADERFAVAGDSHRRNVSKWIRSALHTTRDFPAFQQRLREFVAKQKGTEEVAVPETKAATPPKSAQPSPKSMKESPMSVEKAPVELSPAMSSSPASDDWLEPHSPMETQS